MPEKNFIDMCIDSEESPENITRYVQKWVDSGCEPDLYVFLGFKNYLHYRLYTENKMFLYRYVYKLKKWKSMKESDRKCMIDDLVNDITIFSILDIEKEHPESSGEEEIGDISI